MSADQKAMESEVARLSEKAKGIESLKEQLSRLQKVSIEIDKMEEERKYLEDAKLRNSEELQRLAKLRSEIQQERQQLGDLVSELEIEKTQLQREFALAEAARQEMLKAQRQAAREKQDYEDAKARADAEMKAWQEARAAVAQERKQYEQERFLAEEERRQWEKARTAADADRIRWEEIENEVGKIEYRQQGWKNWLNKSSVGLESIKPRTLDDSTKAPLSIGWPFGSQRPTSLLNRSAPARISTEPSPQSKLGNTLFMAAPLSSPVQGSLPINPEELEKCESVTITLGHLALVKMDFQRADRDGEGALDVQKLGQWVESKGMQSVTYLQLKSMLQQVDVNKSGKIEFWEFFAWQTYLLLQLTKTVDFESWMKFSTQTAYPGALPRPTSRLPPVMTHNKIGLIP